MITSEQLDELYNKFVNENRDPNCYFILDKYLKIIKTEPLLKEVLDSLEKEDDEKGPDGITFTSIEDIINLKGLDAVNGSLVSNHWHIYSTLKTAIKGMELFKPAFQANDKQAAVNLLMQHVEPVIPQGDPGGDLWYYVAMNMKVMLNNYLKELNDFLTGELETRRYLSEDLNNGNELSKINYTFNTSAEIGTLKLGDLTLIFKNLRAQIINYFYELHKIGDEYKTYKNFNTSTKQDIGYVKFRQAIDGINMRVQKKSNNLLEKIIYPKAEINSKSANEYRFQVK